MHSLPSHSSLKRNAHIEKHGSNCFLNNPFPQLYRENRRFAAGLLGQACSLFPFNKYANERVSGLFTCRGSNFPTWTRASDQSPRHFHHPRKFYVRACLGDESSADNRRIGEWAKKGWHACPHRHRCGGRPRNAHIDQRVIRPNSQFRTITLDWGQMPR